jgi:circadian clock protein KaiC
MERVKTGIPGLDKLLNGGFIANSVNLISGGPGTGKTIIGLQFLYNNIVKFNEKGVYISFEENLKDIKKDALIFGWDFNKFEEERKCKFLYYYPFEIQNLVSNIKKEIKKLNAKRLVIDSTSSFGMSLDNDYEVRKHLYKLIELSKSMECTTILTSEVVGEAPIDIHSGGKLSRFDVEEFICDSVITLHSSGLGGLSDRAIRIVKIRRSSHIKGPIPMKIGSKGIEVLAKESKYS